MLRPGSLQISTELVRHYETVEDITDILQDKHEVVRRRAPLLLRRLPCVKLSGTKSLRLTNASVCDLVAFAS